MNPGETLDEHLARHQLTTNRTMANHVDGPACIPGHRAQLAVERGVNQQSDLTDIEHDESCLARSAMTPLEIRQLERRTKP